MLNKTTIKKIIFFSIIWCYHFFIIIWCHHMLLSIISWYHLISYGIIMWCSHLASQSTSAMIINLKELMTLQLGGSCTGRRWGFMRDAVHAWRSHHVRMRFTQNRLHPIRLDHIKYEPSILHWTSPCTTTALLSIPSTPQSNGFKGAWSSPYIAAVQFLGCQVSHTHSLVSAVRLFLLHLINNLLFFSFWGGCPSWSITWGCDSHGTDFILSDWTTSSMDRISHGTSLLQSNFLKYFS